MKRSELSEFAVEEEGFKLKIRRGHNGHPVVSGSHTASAPMASEPMPAPATAAGSSAAASPSAPEEEAGVVFIKSPMVGTFYRAASPESKPFVEAGAKVVENSVVCIIEAMKVMNEIKAEVSGVIVEVLAQNGKPVDFGKPLFSVRPK